MASGASPVVLGVRRLMDDGITAECVTEGATVTKRDAEGATVRVAGGLTQMRVSRQVIAHLDLKSVTMAVAVSSSTAMASNTIRMNACAHSLLPWCCAVMASPRCSKRAWNICVRTCRIASASSAMSTSVSDLRNAAPSLSFFFLVGNGNGMLSRTRVAHLREFWSRSKNSGTLR